MPVLPDLFLHIRASLVKRDTMISVIIPVYRESMRINKTIEFVKQASGGIKHEIIVTDGDPSGSTIKHIKNNGIIKLTVPKGRALQMNAGAARARGDILLFLHADTKLPVNAFRKIIDALSDGCIIGGAFNLGIQDPNLIFRIIAFAASLKHRFTRIPYGDQAIFMLKKYFEDIGRYPEIPLMEDIELMKRIKKRGDRIIIFNEAALTSSRKWKAEGIIFTIIRNWTIQALYMFGFPPERLVKYYYKRNER